MHPGNLRKPFNPAGPFVARRRVLACGSWIDIGELFPHSGIAERRLQQLYDSRKIDMGTEEEVDLALFVDKQAKQPKIELPENWRQLTNKNLFPLVKKILGVYPKNRVEAYELFGEIDGSIR